MFLKGFLPDAVPLDHSLALQAVRHDIVHFQALAKHLGNPFEHSTTQIGNLNFSFTKSLEINALINNKIEKFVR